MLGVGIADEYQQICCMRSNTRIAVITLVCPLTEARISVSVMRGKWESSYMREEDCGEQMLRKWQSVPRVQAMQWKQVQS